MRGIAVAFVIAVLTAACGSVKTGVVTNVDLVRLRRVHVWGGCDALVADALRQKLSQRGFQVSTGGADAMPENADVRIECSITRWSGDGQWAPLLLFLVFLEARSDAVLATGEHEAGWPRKPSTVEAQVEAILDEIYGETAR